MHVGMYAYICFPVLQQGQKPTLKTLRDYAKNLDDMIDSYYNLINQEQ